MRTQWLDGREGCTSLNAFKLEGAGTGGPSESGWHQALPTPRILWANLLETNWNENLAGE